MSQPVPVSGIGSWPGTDAAAAIRLTFGELPDLPYLPELPGRGPGSDLVGRALGLLELPAELTSSGWRLAAHSGVDQRRARARFREDLDLLEEAAQGYEGPLKFAFGGSWTLAALVAAPRGGAVLADPGARLDLAGTQREALLGLLAELGRRLPGVRPILQLDEPLLPAVVGGDVRTESGLGRYRAVDREEVRRPLAVLAEDLEARQVEFVVHGCGRGMPVDLLLSAGVAGISLDAGMLAGADWDAVAGAAESGRRLYLGVVPTADPGASVPGPDAIARAALAYLRPLELGAALVDRLVLTPACGLAGFAPQAALSVLRSLRRAADIVAEQLLR